MLDGSIRLFAIVASVIVAFSFTLFAVDRFHSGSDKQVALVDNGRGGTTQVHQDSRSGLRRHLDDAAHALDSPFNGLVSGTDSDWVRRGIPTLFALTLYGLGLGFLARYIKSRS